MVAKGLDFPNVTLVGVLQADNALIRTDYRAAETAYEMLEQASGRSGRGKRPGEVLIQTFDPAHYVLQAVKNHDYQGFSGRKCSTGTWETTRHTPIWPWWCFLTKNRKKPWTKRSRQRPCSVGSGCWDLSRFPCAARNTGCGC